MFVQQALIKYLKKLVECGRVNAVYSKIQAEHNIPMTMEYWSKRLDAFLEFNQREQLIFSKKMIL